MYLCIRNVYVYKERECGRVMSRDMTSYYTYFTRTVLFRYERTKQKKKCIRPSNYEVFCNRKKNQLYSENFNFFPTIYAKIERTRIIVRFL